MPSGSRDTALEASVHSDCDVSCPPTWMCTQLKFKLCMYLLDVRGHELCLTPDDLVVMTGATVAMIAKPGPSRRR
jgi:hypothetical protein